MRRLKVKRNYVPRGWIVCGSNPDAYDMGVTSETSFVGTSCGYIKSRSTPPEGFGTMTQFFNAAQFLHSRVRLRAHIKSDLVDGWAGLWLRVDTADVDNVLLDNMSDRPIRGKNGWMEYSCVLDVPSNSTEVAFGVLLEGQGQVWFDNFKLEVIEKFEPVTTVVERAPKRQKTQNQLPANMNLELWTGDMPSGWHMSGSHPSNYKVSLAHEVLPEYNVACLKAVDASIYGFGTVMQNVSARPFLGKQVRLSSQLKTEEVEWASLWIRIDGKNREWLGFDNMGDRPIRGTNDWAHYECILDVPEDSNNIAFGVMLCGPGEICFADMWLEEPERRTTNLITSSLEQPVNLNFEA